MSVGKSLPRYDPCGHMYKRLRVTVGHTVEFVSVTERRRLIVVGGVPVLFVALFEVIANFGAVILLLGVGLAAVLYTRTTAQETVAAGAYGVGVLMSSLFVLELYLNGAQGSTEPLLGTAARLRWWAMAGTLLTVIGLWLRRTEF